MFLFSFFCLSSASSFTIDMGTRVTKSAFEGKNRIPEMATNLYSKRLTPSYIAFKTPQNFSNATTDYLSDEELKQLVPIVGEQAVSVLLRHPWAGTGYIQQFIDLSDEESRNVSKKLHVVPPNDTRFKLFNLTSSFLHFYSKMVLGNSRFDSVATKLVVPGSFSQPQINFITDAAIQARLKNVTTIFDWEACANMYAQRRPDVIERIDKTGLFIDVGATSTKAYTIKFRSLKGVPKYSAELKSYHIDYDAGGAYITSKFADYIKEKLFGNVELELSEMSKIMEAAESAKMRLSLLPNTLISIDDLRGRDHKLNVTAKEFNVLISSQMKRMIKVVELEFKKTKPDFIEVIGGGSRVPLFKDKLNSLISPMKFNTSMNADEALAIGGEYYALTHYVRGDMNASFYGVSLCEYIFCHDVLLGTGTDLGFKDNPDLVYFNITTPLRRGIESYNWSYFVRKPANGFTNYFFFTRNPVRLDHAQQCYESSCKNQTVELLRPFYGRFVATLAIESQNRHNIEYLTNELEEKYNFVNQENEIIMQMTVENQNIISNIMNETRTYLWNNNHYIDKTRQLLIKMEKVKFLLQGKLEYIESLENCKEAVDRGTKVIEVIYPSVGSDWIHNNTFHALVKKVEETRQFIKNISSTTTEESIKNKAASLNAWCDALPPLPKLAKRGPIKRFLFKVGNLILDVFDHFI